MTAYDRIKEILYLYETAGLIEGDPVKVLSCLSEDVIGIGMGEQGFISSKKEISDIMLATIRKDITATYTLDIQDIVIHMITDLSAGLCAKVYVKRQCEGKETVSGFMQSLSFVFRDGDWWICLLHASPIMLSEESIESYPLRFADNTLAKLKTELQQDTFELMNKNFSGGVMGIYAKEPYGLYFANNMLIEMLGYERKEFEEKFGTSVSPLFQIEQEKIEEIRSKGVQAMGRDFFWHNKWIKKDGSDIWVNISGRKSTAENGEEVLISVVTDITEIITLQMETQLQNKTIFSSMNYGSKIQRNLLPSSEIFERVFEDYGVLWSPKDVLGGDIYWLKQFEKGSVLVVGDCTGHGIPGALLTMLVVSILDNVVKESNCQDTAEILYELDRGIAGVLNGKQKIENGIKYNFTDISDGCDAAVLFISNDSTVQISASNIYLFICDGQKVERLKGQKMCIGEGLLESSVSINTMIVSPDSNNRFYILSDGLLDQVGGINNQPYGISRLKKLMLQYYTAGQKEILDELWKDFEEYQGEHIRCDDVEVISFIPKAGR